MSLRSIPRRISTAGVGGDGGFEICTVMRTTPTPARPKRPVTTPCCCRYCRPSSADERQRFVRASGALVELLPHGMGQSQSKSASTIGAGSGRFSPLPLDRQYLLVRRCARGRDAPFRGTSVRLLSVSGRLYRCAADWPPVDATCSVPRCTLLGLFEAGPSLPNGGLPDCSGIACAINSPYSGGPRLTVTG